MSGAHRKKSGGRGVLSDRRLAAAVVTLVLAVLVFTPIGARRSLKRAVGNVEEQFFTGVEGRGAAADLLRDAGNAATGLISVGLKYPSQAKAETDGLRTAKGALNDAAAKRDISGYAEANAALVSSFNALREKLLTLELTEDQAESVAVYTADFEGAQGAVSHAGYNEAAEAFIEDTYSGFPAKLLASLLGVDPPELFRILVNTQ